MDDVKPHNLYYQEYLHQKEGRKGEILERKIQRTIILGSNIHPFHRTFSGSAVIELYLEFLKFL
jgi:hypothetical protein